MNNTIQSHSLSPGSLYSDHIWFKEAAEEQKNEHASGKRITYNVSSAPGTRRRSWAADSWNTYHCENTTVTPGILIILLCVFQRRNGSAPAVFISSTRNTQRIGDVIVFEDGRQTAMFKTNTPKPKVQKKSLKSSRHSVKTFSFRRCLRSESSCKGIRS